MLCQLSYARSRRTSITSCETLCGSCAGATSCCTSSAQAALCLSSLSGCDNFAFPSQSTQATRILVPQYPPRLALMMLLPARKCGQQLVLIFKLRKPPSHRDDDYSMIFVTTPEPTVLPPSRIAKRTFSTIAIGLPSVTDILTLSPGMHISAPPRRFASPVTSVVRK